LACCSDNLRSALNCILAPTVVCSLYIGGVSSGGAKHLYADDSQIYTSVAVSDATLAVHCLTACITDVNNWMSASRLRFNPSKTEIMWLGAGTCCNKLKSATSQFSFTPSDSCSQRVTLVSYEIASCHSRLILSHSVGLASISCDRSNQLSGH